jgi:hypothetical protein
MVALKNTWKLGAMVVIIEWYRLQTVFEKHNTLIKVIERVVVVDVLHLIIIDTRK